MKQHILEISQHGGLQIPSELLPQGKLYSHYRLEIDGDTLILRPQKSDSFWATATPIQRSTRFQLWAVETKRPVAPPLSDEALSRETIYD
jgi:hypothetical protein